MDGQLGVKSYSPQQQDHPRNSLLSFFRLKQQKMFDPGYRVDSVTEF